MFENVGYHFSSIEDILVFADWLSESFGEPEEFEEYLAEKFPFLQNDGDGEYFTLIIDPVSLMDDEEYLVANDLQFWDIIENAFEDTNDTPLSGSD